MRFQILSPVRGNHRTVFAGFTHDLLLQLTPPGMRLTLLHCDPSDMPGGRIHIQVRILGLLRQEWENTFSQYELRDDECHFLDTGRKMPFPFRSWRHDHRVLADGPNRTIINDDVTYTTGLLLLDWLMFPIMWAQFRYRRPIYQRVFGKPE